MKKKYHYYWHDEKNDDFANNDIAQKPLKEDYPYIPKNIIYRIIKPIFYYFVLIVFSFCLIVFCRTIVRNRKVLRKRKDKKHGYYIYGNHTAWFTDAVSGPMAAGFRQSYTISNVDAFNIPCMYYLVRMMGGVPVPNNMTTFKNYLKAIDKYYKNGNPVMIYPEAHIWPKYNEIRDFPSVSFGYPAKYGACCFSKTTVYKKNKKGKTHPYIYLDGPFYPNMDLPLKAREEDLCEQVKQAMKDRIKKEGGSYLDCDFEYTKVNTKEEMRTEVTIEK